MSSSRICVKGLPKHATDDRLRKVFSERGEVTDAKVMRAKDGRSRLFGFVGFRDVTQAEDAVAFFNKTFLDTSRITVEFASKYGSSQLGRPWSKYSAGSSANKKLHPDTEEPENIHPKKRLRPAAPEEEDPKLAEFLQVMQPRHKSAIWANQDSALGDRQQAPTSAAHTASAVNKGSGNRKDPAPAGTATTQVALAQHQGKAQKKRKQQEQLIRQAGADEAAEGAERQDTIEGTANHEDPDSDMAYLKSRMRSDFDGDEPPPEAHEQASSPITTSEESVRHGMDDSEASGAQQDSGASQQTLDGQDRNCVKDGPQSVHAAESQPHIGHERQAGAGLQVGDTGRLFVRNLPFTAAEADLAELFQEHGELAEVHLVKDRMTGQSRGLALIQFGNREDAQAAMEALDGSIFQGRLLHILPARPPPMAESSKESEQTAAGGYKAAKALQQREEAGNRAAWNALFMRQDTVAQAIAAHYKVSKAELLDKDAADLAVRMALGETHIVALTKAALAEAGVNVDTLEAAAAAGGRQAAQGGKAIPRSSTALLVKNLPYSANERELQDLFGRCGDVARLVLPGTRTLALVDFRERSAALHAFRTLAYKAFHHAPLLLEWAPAGIFTAASPPPATGQHLDAPAQDHPLHTAEADAALAAPSATVFIKNLAFSTRDEAVRQHFDQAVSAAGGVIRSAVVHTSAAGSRSKLGKGKDAKVKVLSSGFGFVECSSEEVAKSVIKRMQGSLLDGHKLMLQLSMHKPAARQDQEGAQGAEPKKALGTKLIVRNVAFEATRKDISTLFAPFGQMKSCRLPRKYDGNHRGFAFVDFLTKQEAQNAQEAVSGTHLYGRRLVVEWAKPDDALDDLRAKTAAKFRADE